VTNFVTHASEASAKPGNIAGFDVGKGRAIESGTMVNQVTASSCASSTLRAVSRKVLSGTVAKAKAEAVAFLAWYLESNREGCVTLRFDGVEYVNAGKGWKRPEAHKSCVRCGDRGITTSSGGIGCFVCGRAGKGSNC